MTPHEEETVEDSEQQTSTPKCLQAENVKVYIDGELAKPVKTLTLFVSKGSLKANIYYEDRHREGYFVTDISDGGERFDLTPRWDDE